MIMPKSEAAKQEVLQQKLAWMSEFTTSTKMLETQ